MVCFVFEVEVGSGGAAGVAKTGRQSECTEMQLDVMRLGVGLRC